MEYKYYTENKILRDDARRYFWNNGLTYEKAITQENIDKLAEKCNKHIKRYNNGNKYPYFVRVIPSSTKVFNYRELGDRAFLRAKGGYFSDRELISFNNEKDTNTNNEHWIGFAGDADDTNVQPVLHAFIEWCDWLINGGK